MIARALQANTREEGNEGLDLALVDGLTVSQHHQLVEHLKNSGKEEIGLVLLTDHGDIKKQLTYDHGCHKAFSYPTYSMYNHEACILHVASRVGGFMPIIYTR